MTKVYVGGLEPDVTQKDLEEEFDYFGRVNDVWVAKNPPGTGTIPAHFKNSPGSWNHPSLL